MSETPQDDDEESVRPAPMTVGELIAHLQAFPSDAFVLVDGYERGMDYPYPPRLLSARHGDASWYYGRFHETTQEPSVTERDPFRAVYIPRNG
jgi:hypothetical protein